MTERDRVLDAFRNCITEPKCKNCPWTECSTLDNGNVEIPRDLALAVMRELVAQEPRVMTLEEAKSAYVVEYRSGNMREVGSALLDLNVDPLIRKGMEQEGERWNLKIARSAGVGL